MDAKVVYGGRWPLPGPRVPLRCWDSGRSRTGGSGADLLGQWRFDERDGQVASTMARTGSTASWGSRLRPTRLIRYESRARRGRRWPSTAMPLACRQPTR